MPTLIVTQGKATIDRYSQTLYESLKSKGIKKIEATIPHSGIVGSLRYFKFLRNISSLAVKCLKNRDDLIHLPHKALVPYLNIIRHHHVIVTVHDLANFLFPECREHALIQKFMEKNIRKVDHIIADSNNTKKDLIKLFNIPDDKVSVIYLGIDHARFYPRGEREFNFPYIVYVGIDEPRKNLRNTLTAFCLLKRKLKDDKRYSNLKFVKVGEDARFMEATKKIVEELNLENDVVFTGFVSDDQLSYYYSSANLLVFCSLYEGFGLPPLEAMACECPVVASNTSSLPEVIGDAGILVDPANPSEICNAMERLLLNDKLRDELIRKGLKKAKEFSWEKTVKETYKVYREAEG